MGDDSPGREISREYRDQIVKPLRRRGWRYFKSNPRGRGKPRLISPDGRTYSLPCTPSDHRAVKNALADLRTKWGVEI